MAKQEGSLKEFLTAGETSTDQDNCKCAGFRERKDDMHKQDGKAKE